MPRMPRRLLRKLKRRQAVTSRQFAVSISDSKQKILRMRADELEQTTARFDVLTKLNEGKYDV